MRHLLAAALLLALPAQAQQYLPQSSLAACQARSAAQCTAMGCDGVKTVYWWSCQVLAAVKSGGTTALVIQPGDPNFGVTTTNTIAKSATGLSAGEQAAVVSRNAMGSALTDIVTTLTFLGRFTAGQKTAIVASAFSAQWTAIQGAALVDLSSASINTFVANILGVGIITPANAVTILAPQPPLGSP